MHTAKYIKQRNWVAMALAGFFFLMAAGQAQAVTTNSVTWSGSGGPANPGWGQAANWFGGVAPANPTAATVIYNTNGQTVVGVLEADREIGGLFLDDLADANSPETITHTLNLGGHTLTLAGNYDCQSFDKHTFTFTNGILRLGTASVSANLNIGVNRTVTERVAPGTTLDTCNLKELRVGQAGWDNQNATLDLRGATVRGGVLRATSIYLRTGSSAGSFVYLDGNTALSSIEVGRDLEINHTSGPGAAFIGNPADNGRLPPNVSVKVGVSPAERGSITVSRVVFVGYGGVDGKLVASGGGTFTAYLTNFDIMRYEAGDAQGQNRSTNPHAGTVDLSPMNACLIDVGTLKIAADHYLHPPLAVDNLQGTLKLCSGVVTAGTVVVGSTLGSGFGLLSLSNTMFTVTDSFTLNATASNSITLGADSRGLDVQGTFTDGGGKITVNFLVAPALNTAIWAIRIKGDARATLNGMIDAGRLTSTGTYPYKKVALRYDGIAGCTYYAMTDDAGTWGMPAVDQNAGPVLTSDTTATLRGSLVGGGAAYVGVAWGTNAVNLEHTNTVGMIPEGTFSVAVAELRTESDYYYRCFASNANGQAWAPQATGFTPLFREVLALEQNAEFAQAMRLATTLSKQSEDARRRHDLDTILSRLDRRKKIAYDLMSAISALEFSRHVAERALRSEPEVAVLMLRQVVRQRDGAVLGNAVDILFSMNDPEVTALLVDRIRTSKDPAVGLALVTHLERFKDRIAPELAPACREAIQHAGLGDTPAGRAVLAGCAASSQCLTD
jgi:hypothetical protein